MQWLKPRDLRIELMDGLPKKGLFSSIKFHIICNTHALELTFPLQETKSRNIHTDTNLDSIIPLPESCILPNDLKSVMICPTDLFCCCREIHKWNLSPKSLTVTHIEDCLQSLNNSSTMEHLQCLLLDHNEMADALFLILFCEMHHSLDYYFKMENILISCSPFSLPFIDYLITKTKLREVRSLGFNEQKDVSLKVERKPGQLGSSMHYSSFLEITKNVVCFLSNDLAVILYYRTLNMLSTCMLNKTNDEVNESITGTLSTLSNDRPLLCLSALNGVEKCSARETTALTNNKGRIREQQIRNHVEIFFMNRTDIINHEEEKVNGENQTEENKQMDVENGKSIEDGKRDDAIEDGKDQSENQGLVSGIPEIFRFVEVRTGTDIVVCPATQQQVLEPFLNRFSAPDNKPSKHDTMAMEFLRLCSMHDYPSKQGPSLLRLAQAGFYYEGNGDELICFSCGVRNRNWSYGDSPNVIHQRLSPGCKFLTEGGDGNVPVPRNQPTEGKSI